MSADRRLKSTFLAVVLLVLFGFGAWYGFVREDDGAGEIAQDGIAQDEIFQDKLAQDVIVQDESAEGEAARVLGEVDAQAVGKLPEGAVPEAEVMGDAAVETEIAAVDASGNPPEPAKPASGPAAVSTGPVFDIVRVEPTGDAVIAGRSYPGAVVELLRNGVVHDRIVADASGAFAFVPPPFPAGTSDISLRVVGEDGAVEQSAQSVTVVIAEDLRTTPMVALVAPDQPTVVLSRPEDPEADVAASGDDAASTDAQRLAAADATVYPDARHTVRIASVEAEAGGGLYVTGEATPNANIRLYLNDTFIAPAEAGADGTVSFSIGRGVRPGSYRVRLDEVTGETGSVVSRAEIVFVVPELLAEAPVSVDGATASPAPEDEAAAEALDAPARAATTVIPEISTAVVSRGDSLWRISREVYGSGLRYTEIFAANQDQIRNPDLIYPGQLFVLPSDPAITSGGEAVQDVN